MKVALAQILADADPRVNLEAVAAYASRAAEQGAELVVFPEATMRCFGRSLIEVAEPLDGPWATRVREIAAELGLVIIAGMFTPAADGRVANTLLVTGPTVEARYDKVHLFDAFGFAESATVAPGTEPVSVEVGDVRLGLGTCYDVRFPALFTALAVAGAQVLVVPASWGAGPGKVEQWRLLLRARALDTTCFVVGVGQADPACVRAGASGSAPTGVGHSAVVSPAGEVLVELGPAPELVVVDLDLSVLSEVRRRLPVLANRRSL